MKLLLIRARRPRKLLVLPKRAVALPAALLCVCALCLLTTLPAAVSTASPQRQLPIYSVQRDQKLVSLTFDAAWGNARLRRRRIKGLGPGSGENQSLARVFSHGNNFSSCRLSILKKPVSAVRSGNPRETAVAAIMASGSLILYARRS